MNSKIGNAKMVGTVRLRRPRPYSGRNERGKISFSPHASGGFTAGDSAARRPYQIRAPPGPNSLASLRAMN
jgi:hypothetical protein